MFTLLCKRRQATLKIREIRNERAFAGDLSGFEVQGGVATEPDVDRFRQQASQFVQLFVHIGDLLGGGVLAVGNNHFGIRPVGLGL